MFIPLSYIFLIYLFFLPDIHCSCPDHATTCGGINITFPFILETTVRPSSSNSALLDACSGSYPVQCSYDFNLTIKLEGRVFAVKNISYENKLLIVQDNTLSKYFSTVNCGFLEYMTDSVDHFHIPNASQLQNFYQSVPDCTYGAQTLFHHFIARPSKSGNCVPFVLYSWDETKEEKHKAAYGANCVSQQAAMFEWVLSFGEDDGSLSLQSAGFSRKFELREDCFNCRTLYAQGNKCASSSGPIDSSCFCLNDCSSKGKGKGRNWKLIGIVGGLVSFLLLFGSLAIYLARHTKFLNSLRFSLKISNTNQNIEAFLEEYGPLTLKRYSYSHVKEITKSFQERLGQGGCGTVFKGTLSNGHMVAVKILNNSQGNGDEFINEVASIGRTYHVNIVSLLGFCFEGSKRALIYEFMCNGSLEKFLNLMRPKTDVDWEKLYQIAIGIARGLEYLHSGCKTRIIHFDIKPHNILLDENFCPKISDFGLAKLCLIKDSIISIAGARGTVGYIAPEVFSRMFGVVTSKSDVYSYGMMVLEMAEGKKNPDVGAENGSEMYFPHWIYEYLEQNRSLAPFGVTADSAETARKMMLVGLWCIQAMAENRPSMSRVIEMLEGRVDDLQVPPRSYLSSAPFGSLVATSSIQDVSSLDSSFSVQP